MHTFAEEIAEHGEPVPSELSLSLSPPSLLTQLLLPLFPPSPLQEALLRSTTLSSSPTLPQLSQPQPMQSPTCIMWRQLRMPLRQLQSTHQPSLQRI